MRKHIKIENKLQKLLFLERGSDERQYNSPGIDLPIAGILDQSLVNSKYTSLDNFNLVTKGIRDGSGYSFIAKIYY